MVGDRQIRMVQSLLDGGGVSHDGIAVQTGMPRHIVTEVALGLLLPSTPAPLPEPLDDTDVTPNNASGLNMALLGVFGRCPKCGAKVVMPCRECDVRRILEQHRGRIIGND